MKLSRMLLLPIVGILLFAGGCVFDDTETELVINDWMVVPFSEYRTSPDIGSEAICDQTKAAFLELLDRNNVDPEDVISAHLLKGRYDVTSLTSDDHDWTIEGQVMIYRQDDPSGPITDGPELFIKWTPESLYKLLENPANVARRARTADEGVMVLDRAMMALINGEDPRIVLRFEAEDIVPAPTMADPLVFEWAAHARIQLIVRADMMGD
ncbi:MAG: hypothetical protein P8181_05605 [bacterium]